MAINTNTEFVSDGQPFGFSEDEMVRSMRAFHEAPFIPCKECGRKTEFNSVVRQVCHNHFPAVYTYSPEYLESIKK